MDHPDRWDLEVLPAPLVFKALKETLAQLVNLVMLVLKDLPDHLAKLVCPDKTDEMVLLDLPVNKVKWVSLAVRVLVDSLELLVCPVPKVTLVTPVKTERTVFLDETVMLVLLAPLVTLVHPALLVLLDNKVHVV